MLSGLGNMCRELTLFVTLNRATGAESTLEKESPNSKHFWWKKERKKKIRVVDL